MLAKLLLLLPLRDSAASVPHDLEALPQMTNLLPMQLRSYLTFAFIFNLTRPLSCEMPTQMYAHQDVLWSISCSSRYKAMPGVPWRPVTAHVTIAWCCYVFTIAASKRCCCLAAIYKVRISWRHLQTSSTCCFAQYQIELYPVEASVWGRCQASLSICLGNRTSVHKSSGLGGTEGFVSLGVKISRWHMQVSFLPSSG